MTAPGKRKRAPPDGGLIHRELRRKGVTLLLLWEEYVEAHGADASYRYTQFCQLYRDYAGQLKRSMRQEHRAGAKLFADFAGQTLPILDPAGCPAGAAHIFVAVLGASNYTYACATPAEGTFRHQMTTWSLFIQPQNRVVWQWEFNGDRFQFDYA